MRCDLSEGEESILMAAICWVLAGKGIAGGVVQICVFANVVTIFMSYLGSYIL